MGPADREVLAQSRHIVYIASRGRVVAAAGLIERVVAIEKVAGADVVVSQLQVVLANKVKFVRRRCEGPLYRSDLNSVATRDIDKLTANGLGIAGGYAVGTESGQSGYVLIAGEATRQSC